MYCHFDSPQGTAGSQYFAGRQCRVQSGAKVPENPAGGGARTWSGFQALPTQHPLPVHGAGLPSCGRGQFKLILNIWLQSCVIVGSKVSFGPKISNSSPLALCLSPLFFFFKRNK